MACNTSCSNMLLDTSNTHLARANHNHYDSSCDHYDSSSDHYDLSCHHDVHRLTALRSKHHHNALKFHMFCCRTTCDEEQTKPENGHDQFNCLY